jgi:hypothetical protein
MPALQATEASQNFAPASGRYQRVNLSLLGRCMFPDARECPCQLVEISPGEACFISGVCGELGDRVIAYIDNIGRLEGNLIEVTDNGFVMSISASQRKRDKLADTLTWLANRHKHDIAEDRRNLRRTPKRTDATVTFADGTTQNCKVIDMSLSGAGIATKLRPPLGSPIRLGRLGARVVRHFDEGIGIEFIRVMSEASIEKTIEDEYF